MLIEALAYKPLRGTPSLAVLITAIGVSYFLQNAAQLIWSSSPKNYTSIVTFQPIRLFDGQLVITGEVIVTIIASIIIMAGLTWFTGSVLMLGALPPASAIAILFLYGVGAWGIMTLNDFKALEGDRATGVRSLGSVRCDYGPPRCWLIGARRCSGAPCPG